MARKSSAALRRRFGSGSIGRHPRWVGISLSDIYPSLRKRAIEPQAYQSALRNVHFGRERPLSQALSSLRASADTTAGIPISKPANGAHGNLPQARV
jgi:hypothetical protein